MMTTFNYYNITNTYTNEHGDLVEEGDEFTYSPDGTEIRNALAHILHRKYFNKVTTYLDGNFTTLIKALANMIFVEELDEQLIDTYYEDLREWFMDDAYMTR